MRRMHRPMRNSMEEEKDGKKPLCGRKRNLMKNARGLPAFTLSCCLKLREYLGWRRGLTMGIWAEQLSNGGRLAVGGGAKGREKHWRRTMNEGGTKVDPLDWETYTLGAAIQYPVQEELILAGSEARDGRS